MGSSNTKMTGTLKGSVSATGKGLLMFGGRIPKTLKAGRYTVTVVDQSKKAGLVVGQASKRPVTLSAGVGHRAELAQRHAHRGQVVLRDLADGREDLLHGHEVAAPARLAASGQLQNGPHGLGVAL